MLKVWFGNGYPGKVTKRVDRLFNQLKKAEWFRDELNKQIIKAVDKTDVISDFALYSPVLGSISLNELSGGTKTLILIKEVPDMVFDATNCGENCFEWLFKICEKEDRIVVLKYLPLIYELDGFDMEVLNTGNIVHTAGDMSDEGIDHVISWEVDPEIMAKQREKDKKLFKKLKEMGYDEYFS